MWSRKKKVVDIRDLQKRGIVRVPKNEDIIPMNRDGFVEIGSSGGTKSSNKSFFGYGQDSKSSFSTETDGYNKREVDQKIVDLDNKIYKLEQRIELLERKVGVNSSNQPDTSVLRW
ncbi:MAG: hypothetical protein WC494_01255 [Candidatus Pacearchaeota archaeon]